MSEQLKEVLIFLVLACAIVEIVRAVSRILVP